MPSVPIRSCGGSPICPDPAVKDGRCANHQRPERSEQAADWHRMYNGRWRKYRLGFLARNPLCGDPFGSHGKVLVAASVVDHIDAHRGDPAKFWDSANHRPLCIACNSRKAAIEEGGFGHLRGATGHPPGR
jgi:5-methylcytosine-specific restriction protein A